MTEATHNDRTLDGLWATLGDLSLAELDPAETLRVPGPVPTGAEAAPEPGPPTAVDQLGRTLGQGGTGVVRAGRQTSLARAVAVKTVRADALSPEHVRRLLQEAWVTGLLEHPAVVPIYDIATDEVGRPHILMKQVDGASWSTLLVDPVAARRVFGTDDLLAAHLGVLMQVCNAVDYAHHRGILHRDLKPDNVMVGDYGEVYLLDWGAAVALDDRHPPWIPRRTSDRRLVGTPRYMAPEMLQCDGARVDERTDVYLLGATLHHVLVGVPPHAGRDLRQTLGGIPAFAPSLSSDVPPPLAELVVAALQQDPARRPGSVATFREALRTWLARRGAGAVAQAALRALRAVEEDARGGRPLVALRERLAEARVTVGQARALGADGTTTEPAHLAATVALAERELEEGHASAALVLLQGLPDAPEALVARVEARLAETRAAEAAYDAMRRDRDVRIGAVARLVVGALIIGLWVVGPIPSASRSDVFTWERAVGTTAVVSVVALVLIAYNRRALTQSALNRKTAAAFLLYPYAHTLTDLAVYGSGLSAEVALALRPTAWTVVATGYATFVDPRMAPTAVVLAMLAVGALWEPTLRWPLYFLASTVGLINVLWCWRDTLGSTWRRASGAPETPPP